MLSCLCNRLAKVVYKAWVSFFFLVRYDVFASNNVVSGHTAASKADQFTLCCPSRTGLFSSWNLQGLFSGLFRSFLVSLFICRPMMHLALTLSLVRVRGRFIFSSQYHFPISSGDGKGGWCSLWLCFQSRKAMPSSVHPAQGVWDSKSPPFIGSIPILLLSGKNVIFFPFQLWIDIGF